ncbi:thioredoxin family protein [Ideonella sp. BN130291]|uniref:thioredoxin family protein n=1 Tax=Ideonella sp. BN130291 TaxID=3112940 RepID=UPI002E2664C6|nr:thioredoxin family protein [Ideonella sp. BN130291]
MTITRRFSLIAALLIAAGVHAAELPYNEAADAKVELKRALARGQAAKKPVLVIFGANWCQDCRALDTAVKSGKNAELLAQEFEVVKVDVGNFNRNLDLAAQYGNPIKKGIPAAVIVSPDNKVLYATRAGELADARSMNEGDVYAFFAKAAKTAKP